MARMQSCIVMEIKTKKNIIAFKLKNIIKDKGIAY